MQAKKDLAYRIVKDFHNEAAAKKAADGWEQQFQKQGVPRDLESVTVRADQVSSKEQPDAARIAWRVDKLIVQAGLAPSTAEAQRLVKTKSAVEVAIDGYEPGTLGVTVAKRELPREFVVRVGKRMKRVHLVP